MNPEGAGEETGEELVTRLLRDLESPAKPQVAVEPEAPEEDFSSNDYKELLEAVNALNEKPRFSFLERRRAAKEAARAERKTQTPISWEAKEDWVVTAERTGVNRVLITALNSGTLPREFLPYAVSVLGFDEPLTVTVNYLSESLVNPGEAALFLVEVTYEKDGTPWLSDLQLKLTQQRWIDKSSYPRYFDWSWNLKAEASS